MKLSEFDNSDFDRGASKVLETAWIVVSGIFFSSWLPGSAWRCFILRYFGADIGKGVVIKPRVRIKFPWKLRIGDDAWIGESVWIDNLEKVSIGNNTCVSQGVYLCTGNHFWDSMTFDLVAQPIVLHNKCWIGAFCKIGPGVLVGEGAVLTMGSIATRKLSSWTVYSGIPAAESGSRNLKNI